MRKYLYIGCGSFIGAVLRYLIKGIPPYNYHGNIPVNTLFINVSGAFALALILTAAYELQAFDEDVRLGLTTGLLGAYTTFSTLCKETVGLLQQGSYFSAVFYMTVSTVLGLGAVYLGAAAARKIGAKLFPGRQLPDADILETESEVE